VPKKAKYPNLTITPKAMRKAQKHMKVSRHTQSTRTRHESGRYHASGTPKNSLLFSNKKSAKKNDKSDITSVFL